MYTTFNPISKIKYNIKLKRSTAISVRLNRPSVVNLTVCGSGTIIARYGMLPLSFWRSLPEIINVLFLHGTVLLVKGMLRFLHGTVRFVNGTALFLHGMVRFLQRTARSVLKV